MSPGHVVVDAFENTNVPGRELIDTRRHMKNICKESTPSEMSLGLDMFGTFLGVRVPYCSEATSTGFELTPVAIAAGRRLADRLFLGEGRVRREALAFFWV